ncbi:tetratricopeptide repeat protein [Winogradskyella sp. PC D3.3]
MSLTRVDLIKHIERAEELYKANLFTHIKPHITAVQDHIEVLNDSVDYARYYRIVMLYITAFEDINMTVLQSYLEALETIKEVQASDYELICSYYKQCEASIYERALVAHPYNETLHFHYALKLQHEHRFSEAILILKYLLECYPALTEAQLLLWDVESAQLEYLCNSSEESDCYELLELASATHHLNVLKGLQLDNRLDSKSKNLTYIQVDLWENSSAEILQYWNTEWKHLELTEQTQYLLADYAKSFMMYYLVSQILSTPPKPEFPEETFTNFKEYKVYMQAIANSKWQLAQHHHLLVGNSANYYTKNRQIQNSSVQQGLALNPKNPLLLVLKAKTFFAENNYNETAAAYHDAFRCGLRMSEYLFYLLEVNNRIQSWQGILDIVDLFHKRSHPTLKTLYFKARALVKLQRYDEALEVINEALEDFPLPPHSYAPWLYNLRMMIHRVHHNYTAFFEDMQKEINFYNDGDNDYCSTMNMCIEVLLEMGNYKECYKYAIYNHEQGQLPTALYPVFHWVCFYGFLQKPDDLEALTENHLVKEPTTFIDYRNNGLIHWMLQQNIAAAESLKTAAKLSSNKGYYLKLACLCLKENSNYSAAVQLYKTIKEETPEAIDWELNYDYFCVLQDNKQYDDVLIALQHLLQSYPEYTFYNFPKDQYHLMLKVLKDVHKTLGHLEDYTKYNAMYLSKPYPSHKALLEHLEITKTHYKDNLFLQHNILETLSKLDINLKNGELNMLKEMKSKIRSEYFT